MHIAYIFTVTYRSRIYVWQYASIYRGYAEQMPTVTHAQED